MVKILFVCLGNICRSPTADEVMQKKVKERGIANRFEIDSCGTANYHTGELSYPPTRAAFKKRYGYNMTHIARQLKHEDFAYFDIIFAMDKDNLYDIKRKCPQKMLGKIHLYREFDPIPGDMEVPDPWYTRNFEEVLDMCERTSDQIINAILKSEL